MIGIDALAAPMVDASRRAARSETKGGRPNAVFVVSSVQQLPAELDGCADDVRILLPWGSLLEGIVRGAPDVVRPIARLCAPGASVFALVSIEERDGLGLRLPDDVIEAAPRFRREGLSLLEARPSDRREIDEAATSWAKRLRVGRERPAFTIRLERR